MIPCGPCLELLGFCPPLGQFSGVQWKWLQSIATPTSPGGSWRRILSLFSMPIVLAVVVSSSNLVPSVGTMGMQCVGILYCLDLIEIPSYPFSLFKAERSKIIPCTVYSGKSQYAIEMSTPCHPRAPRGFYVIFFILGKFPRGISSETKSSVVYHLLSLLTTTKFCMSIVFIFCWQLKWPQEKLYTMLMQNFVVTNKEHYGMLWYFL